MSHIDAGLIFGNPAAGGEGTFCQLVLKKNDLLQTTDIIAGVQVLNAGGHVELWAAHDAGGNIVTPHSQFGLVGDNRHFLAMTWLAP